MYRRWFVLCVVLFTSLFIMGVGLVSVLRQEHTLQQFVGQNTATVAVQDTRTSQISYQVRPAHADFLSFPQFDGTFMQPGLDAHGVIWMGDMSHQQLVALDTKSHKLTTHRVSLDENGTMATAIDPRGTIWFTGLTGKSLNAFDPGTTQMRSYPMQDANGHSLAVQALAFDQMDHLWFITIGSGQLGVFDPRTTSVHLWSLPQFPDGNQLYPYCFTITANNNTIWIGMLTHGIIAHFDPRAQRFTLYHVQDTQAEISAIAADSSGTIWFTELHKNIIGEIDGATGLLKEHLLPLNGSDAKTPAILSDMTITPDGLIWVACPENGTIVRYDRQRQQSIYYQLPTSQGKPFFLTHDQKGGLWFITHGPTGNGVGRLHE